MSASMKKIFNVESLESRQLMSANLLMDINAAVASSNPTNLVQFGNHVVFDATSDQEKPALWVSDGTAAGTIVLANTTMSWQHQMIGDTLYFVANDSVNAQQVWKTDGTPQGTVKLTNFNFSINASQSDPCNLMQGPNGVLLFSFGNVDQQGLWRTDGTSAGTFKISSSLPGTNIATLSHPVGSVLNGEFYYGVGTQVWKTDGTVQGTQELFDLPADTVSGTSSIGVSSIVSFDNKLFIQGFHFNDSELYVSDGIASGTVLLQSTPGFNAEGFLQLGGNLYFELGDGSGPTFKYQFWKTDGTTAGTTMIDQDHLVISGYAGSVDGEAIFFTPWSNYGSQMWVTDGTAQGTSMLHVPYGVGMGAELNGKIYFQAGDGNGHLLLWQSDGTAAGTSVVAGTDPSLFTGGLAAAGDQLILIGNDSVHGAEPWAFDPASGQTSVLHDFPGTQDSNPTVIAKVGNNVYFTTQSPVLNELWRTDGTPEGTIDLGITAHTGNADV